MQENACMCVRERAHTLSIYGLSWLLYALNIHFFVIYFV